MAITIPPVNRSTFDDVMDALGGDDYSYYLFDVKNVEEPDSTKKVQIALKVFVPQTKRKTAVDNIKEALLENYPGITTNKAGTSLDVPIRDKQVIRIEVKPENSKGSGGGAAQTALVESAQCVYAAMRYYCPNIEKKKAFTTDDFKCGMKHCDVTAKLDEIMTLGKEWQDSSWAGANEIFNKVGGKGWTFVRGDAIIDDGAVKNAFNRVKGQTNLSSEDKWNPADIWMVKDSMEVKKHLDKETTIDCLNNAILQLNLEDKKLVGISLKKIEGKPKMKLMNDIPAADRKKNEKAHFEKYELTFDNGRKKDSHPMDVYLYYGPGKFEKFQARNFGGSTKGDWKLELKGKSAAQGKIQGKKVQELLKDGKFGTLPEYGGTDTWANAKNGKLDQDIYDLLVKYKAKGLKNKKTDLTWIEKEAEQAWKYSKYAGLKLLDWISTHKESDQIMKEIYLYASSQSDKSSVYWKLQ